MSDEHFDIAVIGGGPAGTSAAITAARFGARVVIFEARSFPRHKVCGEFISAEALGVLAVLLDGSENGSRLADVAPPLSRTQLGISWAGGPSRRKSNRRRSASPATTWMLRCGVWRRERESTHARANSEISAVSGDGSISRFCDLIRTMRCEGGGDRGGRVVAIHGRQNGAAGPEMDRPEGTFSGS